MVVQKLEEDKKTDKKTDKKDDETPLEDIVPCDILELCVGPEAMRKAFFECDVFQIFDALKIEGKNKEDFIKFIRSLDFLYDNYEESDKMESERKQRLLSQKEQQENEIKPEQETNE